MLSQFDLFTEVITQRSEHETGVWLSGLDVVELAEGPVRLFSVDGGHTEEIVATDMRTAEQALVPGGIVVADDVFNAEWPGVSVGTLRYLDAGGTLVPFAIGFNKDVAWTHTVSTAYRFTPYEYRTVLLPTKYLSGGTNGVPTLKDLDHRIVEIEAKQSDGSIKTVTEDTKNPDAAINRRVELVRKPS